MNLQKVYVNIATIVMFFACAFCSTANAVCIKKSCAANYYSQFTNSLNKPHISLGYSETPQQTLIDAGGATATKKSSGYTCDNGAKIIFWRMYNYNTQNFIIAYTNHNIADGLCVDDTDGDGLPDDCDFYPNDSTPYSVKLVGYQTVDGNHDGDHVRETYQTDRNEFYSIGADYNNTKPEVAVFTEPWKDPSDICNSSNGDIIKPKDPNESVIQDPEYSYGEPDGSAKPGNDPNMTSGQSSTGSETDIQAQQKIIANTKATADNLTRLGDYLNEMNKSLKSMDRRSASTGANGYQGPSAGEIGQAVKDNLIDPGQTIDKTVADNIPAIDESPALTAAKTKYSDRYNQFITTIKSSDLFSLPFGVFEGPSGSGSAIKTVNIGKWGGVSDQTATIDFSEYDTIWDTLRGIILLTTSYLCFKILILKKA